MIVRQYRSIDNIDYYMIGDEVRAQFMYSYAYNMNRVDEVDITWKRWGDTFIKDVILSTSTMERILKGVFK